MNTEMPARLEDERRDVRPCYAHGRLLYAADIARLMGWGDGRIGVQRARRWMKRNGLAERDGRRLVTTRTELRESFPAAYADAIAELVDRD